MLLIIRFFLLAIVLAFYASSSVASSPCWAHLKPSDTAPRYFVLAMGANTGKLEMANSDAQAFAKAMQKRFNVSPSHVCVLTNVVFRDFMNALKHLHKFVQKRDTVFIYFSGHGTTRKEEDDDGNDEEDCNDEVFVTYPSESRVTDDKFVKWVNQINTQNIITFIDTCFASGMLRGEKGCPKKVKSKFWSKPKVNDNLPPRYCRLKEQLKRLKGILYAASEEQKNAWEYPNKGGIFTSTFLENMKKYPEAKLDKIFHETQKQVKNITQNTACQQHPQRWPKISF